MVRAKRITNRASVIDRRPNTKKERKITSTYQGATRMAAVSLVILFNRFHQFDQSQIIAGYAIPIKMFCNFITRIDRKCFAILTGP